MILPTERRAPKRLDSKRMLLFGAPKSGKTTITSYLDDTLIVDLEQGSNYVGGMIVEINSLAEYKEMLKALKKQKDKTGQNPYKRIVVDTTTALEELSLSLAVQLYRNTPMGVNFTGTDVRTLPSGAGYLYTRQAFFKLLKPLESYCDTLIMIGHVKEKDVSKGADTFTEKSINLTGRTKDILCSWCDAIGLVYREGNKTVIDFNPSDSLIVGSRQKHLIGRKISIAESDEKHNMTVNWGEIFIEEEEKVVKLEEESKD